MRPRNKMRAVTQYLRETGVTVETVRECWKYLTSPTHFRTAGGQDVHCDDPDTDSPRPTPPRR